MGYGELPKDLGVFEVVCEEMLFYQYLPIKLAGYSDVVFENRLTCFKDLISECISDFKIKFGNKSFKENYVYITAKSMFQVPGCSFNREGWHSDGFLTEDINYIWCDNTPTVFNSSPFVLTLDDSLSMREMDCQAKEENNVTFKEGNLLRLNQYNIHKVSEISKPTMRTFVKISFSRDKYDLIGNSKNYLLDYNWNMRIRGKERNIPQKI